MNVAVVLVTVPKVNTGGSAQSVVAAVVPVAIADQALEDPPEQKVRPRTSYEVLALNPLIVLLVAEAEDVPAEIQVDEDDSLYWNSYHDAPDTAVQVTFNVDDVVVGVFNVIGVAQLLDVVVNNTELLQSP